MPQTLLRLRRDWRLLTSVGMALLLVATLLCVVPLYSGLIFQAQLQHELAIADPTQINLDVYAYQGGNNSTAKYTTAVDHVDQQILLLGSHYLSSFAPSSTTFVAGADYLVFGLVNGETLIPTHLPLSGAFAQSYAFDYDLALPHMHVLAGRIPHDTSPGEPAEIMVTPKSGLEPGDTMTVAPPLFSSQPIIAKVVGVWFPKDQDDPYWNGQSFDSIDNTLFSSSRLTYPLLFTEHSLLASMASYGSHTGVNVHRLYFTHPSALNGQNSLAAANNIGRLRTLLASQVQGSLGAHSAGVATRLDTLIHELDLQSALISLPLYIIVAQIAGLGLLFASLTVNVLVESHSGAIAVLRSRGASRLQLLNAFGVPGAMLSILAALVAPLLAAEFTLGVFHLAVRGVGFPDVGYLFAAFSPAVVLFPSIISLILSIGILWLTVLQATRIDILTFRRERGRASGTPFWRRYYLDVALMILGLIGYLELSRLSSFPSNALLDQEQILEQSQLGRVLLATPALLLPAGTLLVMRILPLFMRLGVYLAGRGRGATAMLGFAQARQAMFQLGRLSLLLTFAVGLGVFALAFQTTLTQNAADRAAYATGGDVRLPLKQQGLGAQLVQALPAQFAAIQGVTAVTSVYRSEAKTVAAQGNATVGILGVDPDTLAQMAYWRPDYAGQQLPTLMRQMRDHRGNTRVGEGDSPIWALISRSFATSQHLAVGDRFALDLAEVGNSSVGMLVGEIVEHFPTMYEDSEAGFVVVAQNDYVTALANPRQGNRRVSAPNEYWLRTSGASGDEVVQVRVQNTLSLYFDPPMLRRRLVSEFQTDPLTAGMTGLLLVGAAAAAALALFGGLLQTSVSVRRLRTQFAVLRTLGMHRRQITALLLSQQGFLYLFGIIGGSVLGLLVTIALLPYLEFSAVRVDSTTLGIPPYTLTFDLSHVGLLYLSLLAAMLLSLAASAALVSRTDLARTLRMGED